MIQFPEYDNLYCKYSVVYGSDWTVISVSLGKEKKKERNK